MSTVKINQYIDTPFGQLHIYSDPGQAEKADRLLRDTPKLLFKAYWDAANRYGKDIVKMAKDCVARSIPPKGTNWPALSEQYARKRKASREGDWYYDGSFYWENIGIHRDKLAYAANFSGIRTGARVYIGLPTGVYHDKGGIGSRYNSGPPLTLQKIGKLLESGSGDGKIPPRPLWGPLYKAYGSERKIKTLVTNAIKRQLNSYM